VAGLSDFFAVGAKSISDFAKCVFIKNLLLFVYCITTQFIKSKARMALRTTHGFWNAEYAKFILQRAILSV